MSTSGVSGFEKMLHFARSTGQAHGLSPDDITKLVTFVEVFFEQMRDEDTLDYALMEERVRAWRERPWLDLVRAVRDRGTLSASERLTVVQKCLRAWRDDPWWKPTFGSQAEYLLGMGAEEYDSFLKVNRQGVDFDPRPYLRRVRCPAFVLFGGDDVVVPVEKSASIYRYGLEEVGNRHVTVTIFPGGNHSIQDAHGKYLPAYLEAMVTWIHAQVGK